MAKRWDKNSIILDARKFTSRTEWKDHSGGAYEAAKRNGWFEDAVAHMVLLAPHGVWNEDSIRQDALLYSSKSEWREKNSTTYLISWKHGWLEKFSSHMIRRKKGPTKWTKDDILNEAKKYKTRSEWATANSSSYTLALNQGLSSEACAHMGPKSGVSIPEQEVRELIQKIHPKADKINMRVDDPSIPAKRFEIDVYIPNLNKGVEFNGTYWHSVEGLKKSRSHWSDDQLARYDEIKKNYFLSKNIEILQIKESDWKINKDVQIAKIVDFIGGKDGKKE